MFYVNENGYRGPGQAWYSEAHAVAGYAIVLSRSFNGYTIVSPSGVLFDVYKRGIQDPEYYLARHEKNGTSVMIRHKNGAVRIFKTLDDIYDYISGTRYGEKKTGGTKRKPSGNSKVVIKGRALLERERRKK